MIEVPDSRYGLQSIIIPSCIEKINSGAFAQCFDLREIIFEKDSRLQQIHDFASCSSLVRIDIPMSLEIIGEDALYSCEALNTIVFAIDGRLNEIHGFQKCYSIKTIEIPASVEIIGSHAFGDCSNLVHFSGDCHEEKDDVDDSKYIKAISVPLCAPRSLRRLADCNCNFACGSERR
jgi:hypothetical protein